MNVSSIQKINATKYAIVEIALERNNVRHIERGLFRGLRLEENNPTYIWLRTEKKYDKMCCLLNYTVVSVETYDGQTKTSVFFMADSGEQDEAKLLLTSLKENLKFLTREDDPEIIDTDKYENVPKDFGGTGIITKVSNHKSDVSEYSRQRVAGFQGTGYQKPIYTPKKDPEPSTFKRKARRPSKAALGKLDAKLDLIAKGEYKYKLPKIKNEDKEEDDDGANQDLSDTGHYYESFCS